GFAGGASGNHDRSLPSALNTGSSSERSTATQRNRNFCCPAAARLCSRLANVRNGSKADIKSRSDSAHYLDRRLLAKTLDIILPRWARSNSKRLCALDLAPRIEHRQDLELARPREVTAEQ